MFMFEVESRANCFECTETAIKWTELSLLISFKKLCVALLEPQVKEKPCRKSRGFPLIDHGNSGNTCSVLSGTACPLHCQALI